MTEPITARATLTPPDYVKAGRFYQIRQPRQWIILGAVALLWTGYLLFRTGGENFGTTFWIIPPLILLVGFAFFVVGPLRLGRAARKHERMLADTTWQFSDAEMHITSEFLDVRQDWGAIGRALEAPEHFICTLSINSRALFIIPKRAFSEADQAAFRALLREKGLLK